MFTGLLLFKTAPSLLKRILCTTVFSHHINSSIRSLHGMDFVPCCNSLQKHKKMASQRAAVFPPPLISFVIIFIILESTTTADARELRPADHGLEYYYEPSESSSEMTSFFGPPSWNELNSTPSPSGSILPSAVKSPVVTSAPKDRGDDGHVMNHVLVVGSFVCGVTGVALMVASALIYFRPKLQDSSVTCDQIHNDTK